MRARFRFLTVVAITLSAISCLAFGQAAEGENPTEAPKLIPELKVVDVPFPELIEMLRQADPSFQVVVAYAPESDRNGPAIQELKLKNVSAESVLQLLAQTYSLEINKTATEDGRPIWTVRVAAPIQRGGLYGGSGGHDAGGSQRVTTVHRLREIVDALVSDTSKAEEFRKQARDGVVSLLQTAIDTEAADGRGGVKAVIKLHEPTETLVFRGTAQQAELVQATLDELSPPAPSKKPAEALVNELKLELDRARQMNQALQKRIEDQFSGGAASPGQNPPPAPANAKQETKQPSK